MSHSLLIPGGKMQGDKMLVLIFAPVKMEIHLALNVFSAYEILGDMMEARS